MNERDELLAEIADSRDRLGETVEELAHRLDVKARAHDKLEEVRESVQDTMLDLGGAIQRGGSPAWEQARRLARRRDARMAAGVAGLVFLLMVRRSR